MQAIKAQRLLERYAMRGSTHVEQVFRAMREIRVIRAEGRRHGAATINGKQLAEVLIAVAASATASSAAQTLRRLDGLVENLDGGERLVDAISDILSSTEKADKIKNIHLGRSLRTAVINYNNGSTRAFSDSSILEGINKNPESIAPNVIQEVAIIGGNLIAALAYELNLDTDDANQADASVDEGE